MHKNATYETIRILEGAVDRGKEVDVREAISAALSNDLLSIVVQLTRLKLIRDAARGGDFMEVLAAEEMSIPQASIDQMFDGLMELFGKNLE